MANPLKIKPLILHPTDLSRRGYDAFAHALRLAVAKRTGIYILHTRQSKEKDVAWDAFPHVRDQLAQWGLLPSEAKREDVFENLGIIVDKVDIQGGATVPAIQRFQRMHRYGVDMLVVATQAKGKILLQAMLDDIMEAIALDG